MVLLVLVLLESQTAGGACSATSGCLRIGWSRRRSVITARSSTQLQSGQFQEQRDNEARTWRRRSAAARSSVIRTQTANVPSSTRTISPRSRWRCRSKTDTPTRTLTVHGEPVSLREQLRLRLAAYTSIHRTHSWETRRGSSLPISGRWSSTSPRAAVLQCNRWDSSNGLDNRHPPNCLDVVTARHPWVGPTPGVTSLPDRLSGCPYRPYPLGVCCTSR